MFRLRTLYLCEVKLEKKFIEALELQKYALKYLLEATFVGICYY